MMNGSILAFALLAIVANAHHCIPRDFKNGGTVCVCNSTYCDYIPEIHIPNEGYYLQYASSKDGLRLHQYEGKFNARSINGITLTLSTNTIYQTIYGFGGAFTDAAGINILKLSNQTQNKLLESYFSNRGSKYALGRVPIGGCDFSKREYTYDDVKDDVLLKHFKLAKEDLDYKIPMMKKALKLNPNLKFLAAAWSAPPWMKTNDDYVGLGFLEEEYYQTYSDYLIKFIEAYEKYGLRTWAISTGNEPTTSFNPINKINSMGWTPSGLAKWIVNHFGPTLRDSSHNDTLIIALDDQRFTLPWYVNWMFRNEMVKKYVAGIAVHWYFDEIIPASVLTKTHDNYPEKFLIMTEACTGTLPWDISPVLLGSWKRGEMYILDIIENLTHWVTGWVDWNLALDETGGPNWEKNYADSPIIINAKDDEFYKQPLFYALAHFSRFIPPGSVRIGISDDVHVKSVAFQTPDDKIVIVLYNMLGDERNVVIKDPKRGNINLELPKYSIHTIIYT